MTPTFNGRLSLPPDAADVVLRNDLASFVRASFGAVAPNVDLVWNAYLDLICSRLYDVFAGDVRRLIITLPPRHLKSICVSVALPAFYLGHNPSADVMVVSYGQELAKTFADDTRTVMTSDFYRRIFETRLTSGRQPVHALKTTAGGVRRATSLEGAATGVGADLLIFDDPQKAIDVRSAAVRGAAYEAYRSTFISRSNNPAKIRTVIVMQRLHEDDFVGFVQSLGVGWAVLNLPAIAEMDEVYPYSTFVGRHLYRRPEGAALNPGRISLADLHDIRTQVGEAIWSTQYMQRPAPAGGGVVNTDWFKRYTEADRPSAFDRVIQSWDTASKIASQSDFSVCTTWGVKDKRAYLLDVFRKRLIFPDLKRAVVEQAHLHGATRIVIEDHASGTALIQDLQRDDVPYIEARKPTLDKESRMAGQTAQIQAGFVYIPEQAHWLADYLHELAVFPNGKHDDQVDSTSQALDAINYTRVKGAAFLELAERYMRDRGLGSAAAPRKVEYAPGCMEWAAEQAELAARKGEGA